MTCIANQMPQRRQRVACPHRRTIPILNVDAARMSVMMLRLLAHRNRPLWAALIMRPVCAV
ncbi:hypothetical protein, partial [Komagataeibacter sucrofermentans]|uniref:hypothetical protein n=1 Tax=Komagataeibacter sucrofermentans TaxID=1053551 RepID=UPI0035717505